ncbi:DUF6049 family protein [Actinomadura chibensis]|uniref:Uncharacterized protein n=1 Tax=Actinomadura chibensis TaxID=392828 RepID=A0A5D0NZ34_9ACTN|nr:DUF6049 family protein [Actinomadura chibensis]TYB49281.1 hypothetical protein FXF69_09285 [Actinomadura chibensis]
MRTVRRAVALAALLPCVTMAAPTALPSLALASPGRGSLELSAGQLSGAVARQRVQVGLAFTQVTPKTLHGNSQILISGVAKNRTEGQLAGLTVRLRYSAQPITSRSQLDQFSSGQTNLLPNATQAQPLTNVAAPGSTQNWSFKATPKSLGLRASNGTPGVYPVGVEVLNPAQQAIGGLTTFLTFMPQKRLFKPVSISWVWPLIDRMHRTTDGTFFDDQLTKDMAPGGRLNRLVSAAGSTATPVTWAVDPALMDDAQRIASDGYVVQPFGAKKGAKKEKSPVAARWLSDLKTASKGDPYFTVPYGDPDVVALVRHKTPRDIAVALDARNTGVATQALGRPADARVAWPPYGAAGPGTLEQLAEHQLKRGGSFLMSSSQFQNPASGTPPNATTALQTKQGVEKTVLYDEKLSQIVSQGSRSGAGGVLTEQRFLAETAMIAAEAPNLQRSVVVAPDRHWDPAPGLAERLLTYTKDAAWLRETPLKKIESAQPQDRVFNGLPDSNVWHELGDAHLAQTHDIAKRASTFRAVMTGDITISYERALLRLDSVAWRSMPARAKAAREALNRQVTGDMQSVRIVQPKNGRVLMGGSSGRLPVLIENRLNDQSVTVRLVATSENTAKLRLGQLAPEEAVIELRPGQRAQRWIPAKASGNGNFHVYLELMIPNSKGRRFGDVQTITVRTTGYGRLALLITGAGLAVLFVGVGVRAIRARRRRKAEAAGDGSTGMGSAGTAEQGNGYAGPGFAGPGLPGVEFPAAPGSPGAGLPAAGPGSGAGPGPSGPGPQSPGQPAGAPSEPGRAPGPTGPGSAPAGPAAPGPAGAAPAWPAAGAAASDVPGAAGAAGEAGAGEPGGLPEPAADGKAGRPGRPGKHAAGEPRGRDGD